VRRRLQALVRRGKGMRHRLAAGPSTMQPVFPLSVYGHHAIKIVCWTSNTAVDKHCLFPVSCMCSHAEFDWASLDVAASFLEKPHKIAMEEKRWYQPETRENIR
jgi:hypothetical protein